MLEFASSDDDNAHQPPAIIQAIKKKQVQPPVRFRTEEQLAALESANRRAERRLGLDRKDSDEENLNNKK